MSGKAYVLKIADRIITSNCDAHFKNGGLVIKTSEHETITEICLNSDTVIRYEITFSMSANRITTYGSAQRGMTLIRRHRKEVIVVQKGLPPVY